MIDRCCLHKNNIVSKRKHKAFKQIFFIRKLIERKFKNIHRGKYFYYEGYSKEDSFKKSLIKEWVKSEEKIGEILGGEFYVYKKLSFDGFLCIFVYHKSLLG